MHAAIAVGHKKANVHNLV